MSCYRHGGIMLLVTALLVLSACASRVPGTSTPTEPSIANLTPCPPDTSLSREPLSEFEVDQAPQIIGGLGALVRKIRVPPRRDRGMRAVVEFVVDEAGCPRRLRMLESTDEVLSEAVLDAVRETRFVPGLEGGEPVPVRMTLPTNVTKSRRR